MKTAMILMAQYDGLAIVPVEHVCRDYFRHLTVETLLRKTRRGSIALQVEGNGIRIEHLGAYIDERTEIARQELAADMAARNKFQRDLAAVLAEPGPRVTIYFIEAGKHVKIGMTAGDVRLRLSNLATSHYDDLRILATIPDVPAVILHQRFAQYHVRREWFVLGPEIEDYIVEINGSDATKPPRSRERTHR